jgi:hypothetical protein
MYYSKQTNGFYDRSIHGDNIPHDAVEITAEEHCALLVGQSAGQLIVADENGRPILVDLAAPTLEQLAEQARTKRDALLAETDYLLMPDYPSANKADWEAYRQALRDVTTQEGFPESITWPDKPEVV